jgi:hypothetical protein
MSLKPNLFIIGAMKSGTSSLKEYLGCHPDIFMSQVKEPMHFSREENWSHGNEKYLKLFADATNETYVGEASTEYTKLPFREGVAKRLYDFNSSARLLYLMRDPFNRIVSQYKHMVKEGQEKRSLSDAIKSFSDYLTNSYYAYQLRPYLELFEREAMFIDTFEAMIESPEDFCKRIFRWLKIDDSFIPPNPYHVYHRSPSKIQFISDESLIGKAALRLRHSLIVNKLVPRFFFKWIANVLPKKFEMDFLSEDFQKEVTVTRDAVTPILNGWIYELEKLTGSIYELWPTYHTCIINSPIPSYLTKEIKESLDFVHRGKDACRLA